MVAAAAVMRARAIAAERDHGVAKAVLRSPRSGRWLVCHASCMRSPDGSLGQTALVIGPAPASEITPLITQAYELTPRAQDVVDLIARGCSTAEIAAQLILSTHTVRDYVTAIFQKVGVTSRGELTATLFAEHYAPVHLGPGGRDAVNVYRSCSRSRTPPTGKVEGMRPMLDPEHRRNTRICGARY